ncbi:predicted protein [Uncinocarpus reesii 1704]|uniref:Uncharacterized protein n=1 Tax=Uncinocarpus reesii (strain UAMH 1704) TaxID=336963 RepID=C4JM01_UNCRE|nr:uncharacterized protein UREG_03859 [Uncinocarpus reesii 1704]EEP79013.1 predicted protein [Uncinocarpus reesii 1704]
MFSLGERLVREEETRPVGAGLGGEARSSREREEGGMASEAELGGKHGQRRSPERQMAADRGKRSRERTESEMGGEPREKRRILWRFWRENGGREGEGATSPSTLTKSPARFTLLPGPSRPTRAVYKVVISSFHLAGRDNAPLDGSTLVSESQTVTCLYYGSAERRAPDPQRRVTPTSSRIPGEHLRHEGTKGREPKHFKWLQRSQMEYLSEAAESMMEWSLDGPRFGKLFRAEPIHHRVQLMNREDDLFFTAWSP